MPNDQLSIPVRTDVDLSLHPDVVQRHADVLEVAGGAASTAFNEGREIMAVVYEAIGRVNDVENELLATAAPPRVEKAAIGGRYERGAFMDGAAPRMRHGREAEFGEAAGRVLDRAARDYDARYKRLAASADALERQLEATLADPGERTPRNVAMASEARAYFRGLGKSADRVAASNKAASAGDRVTVAAVLDAPAYLSGFEPGELAALRQGALERLAPAELARHQAAQALLEGVRAAGARLMERRLAVSRTRAREAASPRGRAERALRELAS